MTQTIGGEILHGRENNHLRMHITEGVWDWGGGGSPAIGASSAFEISVHGFPSVKRFELVACDKTLHGSRTGPLNLVHCESSALSLLTVSDRPWDTQCLRCRIWESRIVPATRGGITGKTRMHGITKAEHISGSFRLFLDSMPTVSLPNLTSLWVGRILALCDPTKLAQLGFEWKWSDYGRDEPLSTKLLAHLARFPNVHILYPRPGANIIDSRTRSDVASIFKCNGRICRIEIRNSVVWEWHPSDSTILVSNGSAAPDPAVLKNFHAGFMPNREDPDKAVPARPVRGEEIEQLRDLSQRIVV
ncbi:hypothetical protein B0H17DRAFT_1144687 [Mycena rosella]|uniref:Uncharacterized protein n=1 Tax=Mycena rosella TaxID=1033263 RepID=A0AAD7CSH6_MYCRO|nr:hypothetical protein B0H17DRAFT_1144687 [Mycena rosella]